MDERDQFLRRAVGIWRGEETLQGDAGETHAIGQIECSLGLSGDALLCRYTQFASEPASGSVTFRSLSVYRFVPDGPVLMDFIPDDGPSRTFTGQLTDRVVTLDRVDDQGVHLQMVADLRTLDRWASTSVVGHPGQAPLTVFRAHYTRGPSPSLFRVIIPVPNLAAGRHFYATVLGLEGRQASPGRVYFDCNGVVLACFDPRADGDDFDAQPLREITYLAVTKLEPVREALVAAGGSLRGGSIEVRPWGERSFYATDPFGNPLCFVERGTEFRG
ncbi:MAG: VOC family protein [Myxococcota bacterium]